MSFIRIGSTVHHVRIEGPEHAPALLLVHSLGTDLRIWDDVADRLSDAFRIIRYDIRGHGLSTSSPPPYSVEDLAVDVSRLLDALAVRSVGIGGISVGGAIALACAAMRPSCVRCLILCDTPFHKAAPDLWNERIATVTERGMHAIADTVIRRWFSDAFLSTAPDAVAAYREMLGQCTKAGYVGVCAALRDVNVAALAPLVRCPTLVLCGADDQATPPASNQDLAAAIPGARFVPIESAGHLPCVEQPAAVAAHVASFAADHAHA